MKVCQENIINYHIKIVAKIQRLKISSRLNVTMEVKMNKMRNSDQFKSQNYPTFIKGRGGGEEIKRKLLENVLNKYIVT